MLFKIELAKQSDMLDLFDLANDPLVRTNSFNQENLILKDHERWLAQKLSDKNCYFYILRQGIDFVGCVRFDKVGDSEFVIGIQLHKNFRGNGFGAKIIALATQKIYDVKKQILITAYIKKENKASYKSFVEAGYLFIDDNLFYKNNLCYLLQKNNFCPT